jgi:aldose sugar dehydrogenase
VKPAKGTEVSAAFSRLVNEESSVKRLSTSRPLVSLLLASTMLGLGAAAAQEPVETRPPNASGQQAAFPNQTRAPQPASLASFDVTPLADDLPKAWAMELMPDGATLVTAKAGAMHIVSPSGEVGPAIRNVPAVDSSGQGGLLDVALSPDFANDRTIFFSFSEPRGDGNGTSVARATLSADGSALEDVNVIFRQTPSWRNNKHFGSRLTFAPDGKLFVTVGERSDPASRVHAQDLDWGFGKTFRVNADGSAPADNPFAGRDGAKPEIWSYGHRNVQSAALDGQGRFWTVEHGPRGGDELNRPEAGKNYGWPVITYGEDYSGAPIGEGITARDGMEQPVYFWDPVIGPSGMAWYGDGPFTVWKNSFLIGGLVSQGIVVLKVEGDRVVSEERVPLDARVRDVKVAPDGSVLALTESGSGSSILRISPAES